MYTLIPYILLFVTFVIEMIAFLTGHMVDNRFLSNLHEGIFLRCVYADKNNPTQFNCLWWTSDTFQRDPATLKIVTLLVFFSLISLGLAVVYMLFCTVYREIRSKKDRVLLTAVSGVNSVFLVLILLIYMFGYATDTRVIPGPASTLIFSWSFYMLLSALASSLFATVLFQYNPLLEKDNSNGSSSKVTRVNSNRRVIF